MNKFIMISVLSLGAVVLSLPPVIGHFASEYMLEKLAKPEWGNVQLVSKSITYKTTILIVKTATKGFDNKPITVHLNNIPPTECLKKQEFCLDIAGELPQLEVPQAKKSPVSVKFETKKIKISGRATYPSSIDLKAYPEIEGDANIEGFWIGFSQNEKEILVRINIDKIKGGKNQFQVEVSNVFFSVLNEIAMKKLTIEGRFAVKTPMISDEFKASAKVELENFDVKRFQQKKFDWKTVDLQGRFLTEVSVGKSSIGLDAGMKPNRVNGVKVPLYEGTISLNIDESLKKNSFFGLMLLSLMEGINKIEQEHNIKVLNGATKVAFRVEGEELFLNNIKYFKCDAGPGQKFDFSKVKFLPPERILTSALDGLLNGKTTKSISYCNLRYFNEMMDKENLEAQLLSELFLYKEKESDNSKLMAIATKIDNEDVLTFIKTLPCSLNNSHTTCNNLTKEALNLIPESQIKSLILLFNKPILAVEDLSTLPTYSEKNETLKLLFAFYRVSILKRYESSRSLESEKAIVKPLLAYDSEQLKCGDEYLLCSLIRGDKITETKPPGFPIFPGK